MTSFGPAADRLAAWLASCGWNPSLAAWIAIALLVAVPTLGIVFPIAGVAQYFERKIAALAQRRKGPMVGADGILQLVVNLAFYSVYAVKHSSKAFEFGAFSFQKGTALGPLLLLSGMSVLAIHWFHG